MNDATVALTIDMLEWIAAQPRTYAEAMEAWRSHCPRLSVWDDATLAGLIAIEPGETKDQSTVKLTVAGRAMLKNLRRGTA